MRYVFLATEGFPPTVYASQVADLLAVLARELGLRFDVMAFDPLLPRTTLTADGRRRVADLKSALPGRLIVRPFVPYEDRVGAPMARRLLARELRGPTVVHARGLWAASLATDLAAERPEISVLYDVRGDYVAEHVFSRTGQGELSGLRASLGANRIRRAESRVCRAVARLLCVSGALRDVLEERCPGAGMKSAIVPSGFDPQRFSFDPALRDAWRRRLRLEDRLVVAYAGSLVPYQLPDTIARVGKIARRLRANAHLLLLTPEVEAGHKIARTIGLQVEDYTCVEVHHAEMPGALNAADVGLLLRRQDPVNHVASPTKLAEYLACGLPVLVSEGIGDTSALVEEERVGVVVADPDDESELGAKLAALFDDLPDREHVAEIARRRLARDRFLDVYRRVYSVLEAEARAGVAG